MKLQGIVFFLCGGLTFAFNLHLRTKAFLCSPQTLNYPIPIRAGRWEYFPAASLKATASTPPTVNRNGSVQSVRRFFLKFLKVLVKHPLNLFSRVISISEFKSFMEIATALDSNEKDTIPKIITTNGSNPADKLGRKSVSPEGERWAVAAIGVEFSGKWQLHADNQFKEDYNRYLANLGQPLLVRTVALGLIGRTKEDLRMSDDGKSLFIRGENAKGIWERELVTSGTEVGKPEFEPLHVPIMVRVDLYSCTAQT